MTTRFAQELKKARGDKQQSAFARELGVSVYTYHSWDKGLNIPLDENVTKVADMLGWDDELRLACMKPIPEGLTDLHKEFWQHARLLRLTHEEVGLIMNRGRYQVKNWRYGIPKVHEGVVREFLAMDEQEAYEILMKKEGVI